MQYAIRSRTGKHEHVDGLTFSNIAFRVLPDEKVTDAMLDQSKFNVMHVEDENDEKLSEFDVEVGHEKKGVRLPAKADGPTTLFPRVGSKTPVVADEFSVMSADELRAKAAELGMDEFKARTTKSDMADAIRAKLAETA